MKGKERVREREMERKKERGVSGKVLEYLMQKRIEEGKEIKSRKSENEIAFRRGKSNVDAVNKALESV